MSQEFLTQQVVDGILKGIPPDELERAPRCCEVSDDAMTVDELLKVYKERRDRAEQDRIRASVEVDMCEGFIYWIRRVMK